MTVYLLHFDRPSQHARHSLGSCTDLTRRLAQHSRGQGARLLEVVSTAGMRWQLARTWCGGKQRERQLKKQAAEVASVPSARRSARMLSITRYRNTRYWALWKDGQLLAVTVYKKGAVTLMRRLQQMRRSA